MKRRNSYRARRQSRRTGRKLILVEWIDSHSAAASWQPLDELAVSVEPVRCRSVGWLVAETAEALLIVPHISGEQNESVRPYGKGDIAIPVRAILRRRVLDSN